eukprot:403349175
MSHQDLKQHVNMIYSKPIDQQTYQAVENDISVTQNESLEKSLIRDCFDLTQCDGKSYQNAQISFNDVRISEETDVQQQYMQSLELQNKFLLISGILILCLGFFILMGYYSQFLLNKKQNRSNTNTPTKKSRRKESRSASIGKLEDLNVLKQESAQKNLSLNERLSNHQTALGSSISFSSDDSEIFEDFTNNPSYQNKSVQSQRLNGTNARKTSISSYKGPAQMPFNPAYHPRLVKFFQDDDQRETVKDLMDLKESITRRFSTQADVILTSEIESTCTPRTVNESSTIVRMSSNCLIQVSKNQTSFEQPQMQTTRAMFRYLISKKQMKLNKLEKLNLKNHLKTRQFNSEILRKSSSRTQSRKGSCLIPQTNQIFTQQAVRKSSNFAPRLSTKENIMLSISRKSYFYDQMFGKNRSYEATCEEEENQKSVINSLVSNQ